MEAVKIWMSQYMPWLKMSGITVNFTDVIEILVISFLVYSILIWIKNTRAWTLIKGILLLVFFVALIYLFEMDTLTYIISKGFNIVIIAAVIIFQPELRKALEHLGEKAFLSKLIQVGTTKEVAQRCSDRTVNEIVRASLEMAKVKTGALMVLEQNETLQEYERTGIDIHGIVSSQLLINIFEHNTPLHDGAVIIRGDEIVSATCYLPLSEDRTLGKELGTRHRAGVGISEVTDSLTIIVSEETGKVSIAYRGVLKKGITEELLREYLILYQNKSVTEKKRLPGKTFMRKKGKAKNEV